MDIKTQTINRLAARVGTLEGEKAYLESANQQLREQVKALEEDKRGELLSENGRNERNEESEE